MASLFCELGSVEQRSKVRFAAAIVEACASAVASTTSRKSLTRGCRNFETSAPPKRRLLSPQDPPVGKEPKTGSDKLSTPTLRSIFPGECRSVVTTPQVYQNTCFKMVPRCLFSRRKPSRRGSKKGQPSSRPNRCAAFSLEIVFVLSTPIQNQRKTETKPGISANPWEMASKCTF